jgi:hypothetical protein
MKPPLLVILAALASMSLIGCTSSKSPASVTLRWHDTGQPVTGAEVWLQEGTKDGVFSGATSVTDQSGSVVLDAPVNKDLMVSVTVSEAGKRGGYLAQLPHPKFTSTNDWVALPPFDLDKEPVGPAMDMKVSRPSNSMP